MMQSTEFSITPDGKLLIALTAEGYSHLQRLMGEHPDWNDTDIFTELIDYQLANGWSSIPLAQIRVQTRSMVLSNTVRYDDEGNITYVGHAYWYPAYENYSYSATLLKNGFLIFEGETYGNTL